jgi:hypothetical protein
LYSPTACYNFASFSALSVSLKRVMAVAGND